KAASTTACRGVRTLVETTVAIELAVSWNPLMYSKTSATRMTIKRRVIRESGTKPKRTIPCRSEREQASEGSRVLQSNVGDDVAGIPTTIDDFFEQLVEILQRDYLYRVVFATKQVGIQNHHLFVGFAFEKLQLIIQV